MSYPLYEDKLDQETATSLVWQSYPILVRGQESQELSQGCEVTAWLLKRK